METDRRFFTVLIPIYVGIASIMMGSLLEWKANCLRNLQLLCKSWYQDDIKNLFNRYKKCRRVRRLVFREESAIRLFISLTHLVHGEFNNVLASLLF